MAERPARFSSHSHIEKTDQPCRRSFRSFEESRWQFRFNLGVQ